MTQQRRFTKEFEGEAVRMVESSGRTQREIAGDLGIGLSTLVRWIGRSRGSARCRPIGNVERSHGGAEAAAPRERDPSPGRDILKKATAFFAREGSR